MKELAKRIVPAVLTDNPEHLTCMIRSAEQFTDWVQIDIMDGQFVQSRSISALDIANAKARIPWEAHLMVLEPQKYIDDLHAAGASRIIVHYEAVNQCAEDVIDHIISLGSAAGIVLNPETPVSVLSKSLLSKLDSVLFMAVHPGFYGAPFIPKVLDKIKSFRMLHPDMSIGIDGGVKTVNMIDVARSGANEICAGSAIFAQSNYATAYRELTQLAQSGW